MCKKQFYPTTVRTDVKYVQFFFLHFFVCMCVYSLRSIIFEVFFKRLPLDKNLMHVCRCLCIFYVILITDFDYTHFLFLCWGVHFVLGCKIIFNSLFLNKFCLILYNIYDLLTFLFTCKGHKSTCFMI